MTIHAEIGRGVTTVNNGATWELNRSRFVDRELRKRVVARCAEHAVRKRLRLIHTNFQVEGESGCAVAPRA